MTWPLTKFTLSTDKIVHYILDILTTGAAPAQQHLLVHLEELATVDGYNAIFANWGVKLDWMKTVRF